MLLLKVHNTYVMKKIMKKKVLEGLIFLYFLFWIRVTIEKDVIDPKKKMEVNALGHF